MLSRPRRRPSRSGATVVEAAAVIILFMMFLFSIVEYGRYIGLRQAAENAARNAARWALCNTSYNSTNGLPTGDMSIIRQRFRAALGVGGTNTNNIVESQLTGEVINAYRINPVTGANIGSWDSASSSDTIAVELTGQFRFVVPNFLMLATDVLNVRVRVLMRAE